jgi:plasmid maintenance system killer protein
MPSNERSTVSVPLAQESNESIPAFEEKKTQKLEAFDTAESNESIPAFDEKNAQKLEAFDAAKSTESIHCFRNVRLARVLYSSESLVIRK